MKKSVKVAPKIEIPFEPEKGYNEWNNKNCYNQGEIDIIKSKQNPDEVAEKHEHGDIYPLTRKDNTDSHDWWYGW